ncbi:BTB/POZ domain-containing protein [Ananas comosus]|uniref:BTB/POZ domain-containing protein n=1 Tax=Ananas comosus TaxID=4615 RepID=A0A199V849_ANACO|nr:BTB/POZ domain-containing protein [Ananas comosus]
MMGTKEQGSELPPAAQPDDRIKLNVGGKLFETTVRTLQSAGPDSLLAALSLRSPATAAGPVFIDRDPDLFSALLSLLRSGRLPSSAAARRFSEQDLLDEALYYGLDSRLRAATAPPPLLGFDAFLSATLVPAADALPTALSAGPDGSLWVAHAGQISSYGWTLAHAGTLRTHLDDIASLRRVCPEVAALGSLDSPGLHFYHVAGGRHVGSVHWSDPTDPRVYKARVTAIAAAGDAVFAAFECPHRENCVLAVDPETLRVAAEIGRQSGSMVKSAAPGRLAHVRELGLVFASAVSAGAFGYSGYMRLWDPRSGEAVWETSEPGGSGLSSRFGDTFADADVDGEELAIYKVCWKSGDVGVADLRRLGTGGGNGMDPWVYPTTAEQWSAAEGGENSIVHCYKRQVFVSRGRGLEVWSQLEKGSYRRSYVDGEEDARRGMVRRMEGGGDRLFVSREGMEGVEVWESSYLSRAVSLP